MIVNVLCSDLDIWKVNKDYPEAAVFERRWQSHDSSANVAFH